MRHDAALLANAAVIEREMAWLERAVTERLYRHAEGIEGGGLDALETAPYLPADGSHYAELVLTLDLDPTERLVLALAYAPYIRPESLDSFLIQNDALQRRFTEFGGHTSHSGGLSPTGETAMFLICGDDLAARLALHHIFAERHAFKREGVLSLDPRSAEEPPLAGVLRLSPECVERLTTGRSYSPAFGPDFPAQRLSTHYEWHDLVLDRPTRAEIDDIVAWVRHEKALLQGWGLAKRLKPGYRALFHGPPGTGKTLTASLLGKAVDRPVYRIDLSKVISKYIGETEKNLANLFDHAQHQDWILFFDEADSLFSRRTETSNANDRAANQQVSYLLQRIEDFPGVVILATNLKSNLDEAFGRRFQSTVLFKMPDPEQRLHLWRDNFEDKPYDLAPDVNLAKLANDYELAGGAIINVLRYACLRAVARDPQVITNADLLQGVRRELHKDGKFLV